MGAKNYKNLIIFGLIITIIFGILLYTMNRISSTESLRQEYSKLNNINGKTIEDGKTEQEGETYVPGKSKSINKVTFTGSDDVVIKGNTICLSSISNKALCQKYDTKKKQYSLNLIEYDFVNESSFEINLGRYVSTQNDLNSIKKIEQAIYLSENEILAVASDNISKWIFKYNRQNNEYITNHIDSAEELKWSPDKLYAATKVGLKKIQLVNNETMSNTGVEFNNADIIDYGWVNKNQIYVYVGNQYTRQLFLVNRSNTYTSKIADLDKNLGIKNVVEKNSGYILLTDRGVYSLKGGNLAKITDTQYSVIKNYNGYLYLYGQGLARLNSQNEIEEIIKDKEINNLAIYDEEINELVYTSGEKAYLLKDDKSEEVCPVKEAKTNIEFIDDTLIINAKDDDGIEPLLLNVTNISINNIY